MCLQRRSRPQAVGIGLRTIRIRTCQTEHTHWIVRTPVGAGYIRPKT